MNERGRTRLAGYLSGQLRWTAADADAAARAVVDALASPWLKGGRRAGLSKQVPRPSPEQILGAAKVADWHVMRCVPFSPNATMALILALGCEGHVRKREAMETARGLFATGATVSDVAEAAGFSTSEVGSWPRRLSSTPSWSSEDDAVAAALAAAARADARSVADVLRWFTSQGRAVPDALWHAALVALGLATMEADGGVVLRPNVLSKLGGIEDPEKFIAAGQAESNGDGAMVAAVARRFRDGDNTVGESRWPRSLNGVATENGIDRRTIRRWRGKAAYQANALARDIHARHAAAGLASLLPGMYDARRDDAAQRLGVDPAILDALVEEVKRRRSS